MQNPTVIFAAVTEVYPYGDLDVTLKVAFTVSSASNEPDSILSSVPTQQVTNQTSPAVRLTHLAAHDAPSER